jgi:hypothetical protein
VTANISAYITSLISFSAVELTETTEPVCLRVAARLVLAGKIAAVAQLKLSSICVQRFLQLLVFSSAFLIKNYRLMDSGFIAISCERGNAVYSPNVSRSVESQYQIKSFLPHIVAVFIWVTVGCPGSGFLTPAHKLCSRSKHWQSRDRHPQALKTTPLHTHTIPTSSFPFLRPSTRSRFQLIVIPSQNGSVRSLQQAPPCSWPWEDRI